jgi:hypothetical protein
MLELRCEWLDVDPGDERTGYDLGHMTFLGENGECSSRGKNPDQAMMVAIAAGELLYGLGNFVAKKLPEFRFIGADSSFSVYFRRRRNGRVDVRCGGDGVVSELSAGELLESVLTGVEDFAARAALELPADDPVRDDLFGYVRDFKVFLGSRRSGLW